MAGTCVNSSCASTAAECWPSSAAHTHVLIPPYSPPHVIPLSQKIMHPPSTPTIEDCHLDNSWAMWAIFPSEILFMSDEQLDEFQEDQISAPITLDNEIHPLFAQHNMHGMRYDPLVPALRLATLMLTTSCLLDYWYAAFFSLEEYPYANDPSKTYKAIARKKGPLTAKEIAQVKYHLLSLVAHVRFYRPSPNEDGGYDGMTRLRQSRIDSADSVFHGFGSDIFIGGGRYDDLCAAYDGAGDFSANAFREQSLSLAITLCHELAHAAAHARFGNYDDLTPGFENQHFSEDGFDWENCIFGGCIQKTGGVLTLIEWPSPELFESYVRHMCGGGMFVQSAPEPEVQLKFRVPASYVGSLFDKTFWQNLSASDGLKVPKLLGYRSIPAGPKDCCQCANCRIASGTQEILTKQKNGSRYPPELPELLDGIYHNEYPGWSHAEVHELPCERHKWGSWPWGPWTTRSHGRDINLDPLTGVPTGYQVLLDGSIVADEHADEIRWFESESIEDDESLTRWTLQSLEVPIDGAIACDNKKTEEFKRLAGEMLASDDPARRRMLGGLLPLQSWYRIARSAWEAEQGQDDELSDDEDDEENSGYDSDSDDEVSDGKDNVD